MLGKVSGNFRLIINFRKIYNPICMCICCACAVDKIVTAVELRDGSDTIGAGDGQAHIKLPEQQVQSWLKLHARMAYQYPAVVPISSFRYQLAMLIFLLNIHPEATED